MNGEVTAFRRRKGMGLAAAAVAVFGLSVISSPDRPTVKRSPNLTRSIPSRFRSWKEQGEANVIDPSTEGQALQIYDEILSRAYVDESARSVMLCIAYGGDQSDSLRAHRQETCYRAQGFRIESVYERPLRLEELGEVNATCFVARLRRRQETVSYWMTMGSANVRNRVDRLIEQVKQGFFGTQPDGFLVRVSSLGQNPDEEISLQTAFLHDLLAAISPELRVRLLGGVSTL